MIAPPLRYLAAASAAFLLFTSSPAIAGAHQHYKARIARKAPTSLSNDFGGGDSPLRHRHRYGVTSNPLTTCVALNNSTIIANGKGEITGPVMNAAIGCPLTSVIPAMGTFVGGVWYPSIPPGYITSTMLASGLIPTQAGGDASGPLSNLTINTIGGLKPWREAVAPLTVTATNTLSALPNTYDGRACKLFVNGVTVTDKDANAPFSVSGTTVSWSPTNAGYALQTNFVVTSDCTY